MTLIKELIDIPPRVQKGDFVLRLAEDFSSVGPVPTAHDDEWNNHWPVELAPLDCYRRIPLLTNDTWRGLQAQRINRTNQS